MQPSLNIKSLTFSDGTTLQVADGEIIVLVGPNNAGKSAALKDIEDHCRRASGSSHPRKVIIEAVLERRGKLSEVLKMLEEHAQVTGTAPNRSFYVRGNEGYVREFDVGYCWGEEHFRSGPGENLGGLSRLFCVRCTTEERLSGSDAIPSVPMLESPGSRPIEILYKQDEKELMLGSLFRPAFGKDLIVFRLGGSEIPLLVGNRPEPTPNADRLSKIYNEKLRTETEPLQKQGDGMRAFATVLLEAYAFEAPSLLLIDEPEAFLHPPQARFLGNVLASRESDSRQLFIATHSQELLHGMLESSNGKLRIVRIERDGKVNRVKELDPTLVRSISSDPVMKFTSVLSGIFHERVIVCESDSDCMFYSSILDVPGVHGARHPDVLFVQGGGKQRIAKLADTLTSLDVQVDAIVDIDILNDLNVMKQVVESLKGDWSNFEPLAKRVKAAIEKGTLWKDAREVKKEVREILEKQQDDGAFSPANRDHIKEILRQSSQWDAIKKAGRAAIPNGDPTKDFDELLNRCSEIGLWLVEVGELEGFCKSEGAHGPKWVQSVLGKHDPASSSELAKARSFVKKVWARKRNAARASA